MPAGCGSGCFPDQPVSKKPAEVRMGKGKGSVEYWVAPVKAGRIMFEIDGVPADLAEEAIRRGAAKLPVRTRFIMRPGGEEAAGMKAEELRGRPPIS